MGEFRALGRHGVVTPSVPAIRAGRIAPHYQTWCEFPPGGKELLMALRRSITVLAKIHR
jgi:hypothetical protein